MSFMKVGGAAGAAVVVAALCAGVSSADAAPGHAPGAPRQRHVLLLSVDGMHQRDLAWFVRQHPASALARLVHGGTSYSRAQTPVPSDSFPGMVGQVTGGNPRTTGVYYDDTFNHDLLPAGTTNCATAKPGAEVAYTESDDKDPSSLDAGQGLPNLPDGILQMTGSPQRLLDPKTLPVDPKTCRPVYPHQYLHVNTVFEVAKQAGLHTAWSDKHPAYEILNGPSGTGLDDLFAPEINSAATGYGAVADWTKDNAATQQYDGYKVKAVLNEIDGYDHSRSTVAGVPAIFGMNFQSVSTAQKLPTSDGMSGGYLADGVTPGPLLSKALDFVDASVGSFEREIASRGLAGDTTLILSAKHGQSPTDPAALTRVDDGPIIDGINAAWKATHPGADLVTFASDDDIMQLWLSDRSAAAAGFVREYLRNHPATGDDITGAPRTVNASGLSAVYAGDDAARYFGVSAADPRHPDVLGIAQHGVVYTGGRSKIAEHGGADPQDRDVPLVVFGAASEKGHTVAAPVETTQISPSILRLLGLDPNALQAVRIEHTRVLPGVH